MARRSNSLRVRRRQSDAKWRASVANCYTTLKIITSTSSSKKKKRKFSKAHILQETVNYISYLEAMLSTFLDEKDKMIKNGSLPNTSHSMLGIEQVRQEFSAKQAEILTNGMTMRKCSSSLDDLLNEAFEVDSTVSSTSATKITETPVLGNRSSELPKTEYPENSHVSNQWNLEAENESSDVLPIVFSPFKEIIFNYSSDQEVVSSTSSSTICKLKDKPLNVANSFSRDPLRAEIKIEEIDLFETPKKQTGFTEKKAKEPTSGSRLLIRPLPGGNSLFTPLKSPPVFDLCISPIATPYRMQLSNYLPSSFIFSTPENVAEKTSTRQESIDVPDSVTPSSKSSKQSKATKNDKHGTTCRKRLDKLFTEPKSERDSSFDLGMHEITDEDSLDFDGYFLFYKQFLEELKQQTPNAETLDSSDLAKKVSRMWSTLPAEEKSMIVAMAALEKRESHNIKLTDDLRNLDVKRVLDIDNIDDAQLFNKNAEHMSQVVPEMNFNQPSHYPMATATCSSSDCEATVSSLSQCIVPEYNPTQTGPMNTSCSSPFTPTSNSLPDQFYWKGLSPLVNQTFKMENAMDITYNIIDIQTIESMEFAAANMKSECEDGQLVPIWDGI